MLATLKRYFRRHKLAVAVGDLPRVLKALEARAKA